MSGDTGLTQAGRGLPVSRRAALHRHTPLRWLLGRNDCAGVAGYRVGGPGYRPAWRHRRGPPAPAAVRRRATATRKPPGATSGSAHGAATTCATRPDQAGRRDKPQLATVRPASIAQHRRTSGGAGYRHLGGRRAYSASDQKPVSSGAGERGATARGRGRKGHPSAT